LENQKEVCQKTRILEVLEEVSLTLRSGGGKKESAFSSFRFKMVLLQLSMMEGNVDEEIPKKIAQFFNA
jgi:hypothetical protein